MNITKPRQLTSSSRHHLAGSQLLSFMLMTFLALPGLGLASLRGSASSRSFGERAGTTFPAEIVGKPSTIDLGLPHALAASTALPQQEGLLYLVNSTGDGGNVGSSTTCNDGTGKCTLRAAIQAANLHVGDDAIRISIPVSDPNCVAGSCTINLMQALPPLSTNMSINGPGADKLTVRRLSTGDNYSIFTVTATGTVTLSNLTISNGVAQGGARGGGIRKANAGTVNVTNCVIKDNVSQASGGGVAIGVGTLNLTNSTVNDNEADFIGGGIVVGSGTANITNSTIHNNLADHGGGIGNGGTTKVTNSTISDNVAALPVAALKEHLTPAAN